MFDFPCVLFYLFLCFRITCVGSQVSALFLDMISMCAVWISNLCFVFQSLRFKMFSSFQTECLGSMLDFSRRSLDSPKLRCSHVWILYFMVFAKMVDAHFNVRVFMFHCETVDFHFCEFPFLHCHGTWPLGLADGLYPLDSAMAFCHGRGHGTTSTGIHQDAYLLAWSQCAAYGVHSWH